MKTSEKSISENFPSVVNNQVNKAGIPLVLVAVLLMIFLVPINTMASRERFVLDFNDSHITGQRGEPATLFLKRSLKQQYPWVKISNIELRRAVLVAKSKVGRGNAQLRVGNRVTEMNRVDGHPSSFRDRKGYSFDRVNFWNPSRDSRGPWQVDLKGNFIVRKVVLEVENYSRPQQYRGFYRDK
ncbi:MAG: hypothetical protein WBB19_05775 [Desulforhopalus sp.]